jgi:hypothetical protein
VAIIKTTFLVDETTILYRTYPTNIFFIIVRVCYIKNITTGFECHLSFYSSWIIGMEIFF